jgi:ParB family chromosome partitioning protein
MKLPEGKTRLDLVREGLAGGLKKTGRLVVSLDRLVEDPRNERRVYRNMEGLIASIKAVGVVEPLTVTPESGDTYRIVTGHRRYRAAKAAGLSMVEVLIREPEEERKRRQKSIISNVQREDVGPVELAEALQTMLDEDPAVTNQDALATLIGKEKTWVSGMLRVLSLPPDLRQQVGSTQLSLSYDSIIRIARLDDPRLQRELIEMLLGGASQRDIRTLIEATQPEKRHSAGTAKPSTDAPKPKRAFKTEHQAIVVVQSTTSRLTPDRVVLALRAALQIAYEQASKDESESFSL